MQREIPGHHPGISEKVCGKGGFGKCTTRSMRSPTSLSLKAVERLLDACLRGFLIGAFEISEDDREQEINRLAHCLGSSCIWDGSKLMLSPNIRQEYFKGAFEYFKKAAVALAETEYSVFSGAVPSVAFDLALQGMAESYSDKFGSYVYDPGIREDRDTLSTAGTLLGTANFAEAFYCFCGIEHLSVPAEGEVPAEAVEELLVHAAASVSGMDVAGQFCQVAQRCLADGVFTICDADRDDSDRTKPIVYLIQEDYGFTTEAFRTICRRMSQSMPVIVRALVEEGLLRGKRINATTAQTRIPVTGAHGVARWTGVYRIAQEDILNGTI